MSERTTESDIEELLSETLSGTFEVEQTDGNTAEIIAFSTGYGHSKMLETLYSSKHLRVSYVGPIKRPNDDLPGIVIHVEIDDSSG